MKYASVRPNAALRRPTRLTRFAVCALGFTGLTDATLPTPCQAAEAGATADTQAERQPPRDTEAALDASTSTKTLDQISPKKSSRRHFESGIKLYEDANYEGALAEFEAAYRTYPSASSLQNVALCQKQLYRYSDARKTLLTLLELHQADLTPTERVSVRDATTELLSLVGSVRIEVMPRNASITLDGRTLSPNELALPITLDVGEHHLLAQADGFATLTQIVRVAGGHVEVPVSLVLTETTGILKIVAPDQQTAIAIDGRPIGYASFDGRIAPGKHFVQIYREGFEAYEEQVDLAIGETVRVVGEPGDPLDSEPKGSKGPTFNPTGWYGAGIVSTLAVRGHPVGFRASSDYDMGYELGVTAGYRISVPVAFEGQLTSGSFRVQGHCSSTLPLSCPTASATQYHLDTRRLSAHLRLMSRGDTLRFVSSVGAGAVAQTYDFAEKQAQGFSPSVQLSLGISLNFRHALWEILGTGIFDGASDVRQAEFRPYETGSGMQFFGIALRVGYSEWTHPQRTPPLPTRPPQGNVPHVPTPGGFARH